MTSPRPVELEHGRAVAVDEPPVEIRRSERRRRTVSARLEGNRIVVMVPARLSASEERRLVAEVVAKVRARARTGPLSDAALERRAEELSRRHLDGRARPASVRWVTNQRSRWGSCTPATGEIRLSTRLQTMPGYVIDYVLLHELAHLLVPRHGSAFWALLEGYPQLERARGFLDGVSHSQACPAER